MYLTGYFYFIWPESDYVKYFFDFLSANRHIDNLFRFYTYRSFSYLS